MSTTIRKATETEIEILSKMRVQMLFENSENELSDTIYNNTKQFIKDGLQNNNLVIYIAVDNENIIAMGMINFFDFPPNDWCASGKTTYIGNMFTLPRYRNHGIATKILSLLVEEATTRKSERILLNPTEMGKPLYEKSGFKQWSEALVMYPFNESL